ncbi:mechanosensitive ion channel family protein [Caenispirillum bisanense]|nr:mechanosensitive ion channel family protein [Caenispirillum bisanense]
MARPAALLAVLFGLLVSAALPAAGQDAPGGGAPTPAAASGAGGDQGADAVPPSDRVEDDTSSEARKLWRPTAALNVGLPEVAEPPDRATPRSALAAFMDSAAAGDYLRAARVLDLADVPEDQQSSRGSTLARQLHYLLDRKVSIDWHAIPDRRDGGRGDRSGQAEVAPEPRRYIDVAELTLNGRPVGILLERVKPRGQEPLWLFPPTVVEQTPRLYDEQGPSLLQRRLPDLLTQNTVLEVPVWEWMGLVLFAGGCILLGWLVRLVLGVVWRRSDARWTAGLTGQVSTPLIGLVGLVAFKLLIGALLNLTGPILRWIDTATLVAIVLAATWLAIRLVSHAADVVGAPFLGRSESEEDPEARRRLTQISVGKRLMIFIVLVAGIGMGLSFFEESATVGLSFLFSAGAASVILGIAAQSVLSNILAGMQIAITEPVRIGDNVVFEGEWGWVEEITYTYVTIRTWDKRRLVVPHSYFLDHPVENWSKSAPQMIMPVFLHADYHVPVQKVRDKLAELLEAHKDWDHAQAPSLYVTALTPHTVELRALVSARDPLTAWYLHAEVREELLAYLQGLDGGRYLPRRRVQAVDDDGDASADVADRAAGEEGA